MTRKPNFFIIGAPKCGTTALSFYLSQHPHVFFSEMKEPYFFASDFPRHRAIATEDDYLKLFASATDQHLAIGEGSAGYLYSAAAVPGILKFNARAKMIVMLRNPVDLVYSMHAQALYDAYEDEVDFRTAWNLQSERKQGRRVPRLCRNVNILFYRELASMGGQMERLLKLVPREQVHVILHDDFVKDPAACYRDVCQFLGVPSDGRSHFPRVNESKQHRIRALSWLTARPPRVLVQAAELLKRSLGLKRLGILDLVQKVFVTKYQRLPLPDDFRAELIDAFREDVTRLSLLLNRDLTSWAGFELSGTASRETKQAA